MKQKLVSGLDLNNTSNFIAGTQYDVKQQQQQQAGAPNQIQTSGAKNPKLDPSDIPETIITEISEQILWKTHFIFQKYGDILLEDDNDITQSQKQSKKERRLSQQLPNSEFANTLGKAWEWTRHKYTSKIEGILLYFSRLIRPVWNRTLVNGQAFQYVVNEPAGNFHRDETQTFIRRINEFSYWLENETKLIYCKEIKNQNSSNGSIVGLSDTSSQTLSAGTQLFQQQQGYNENGNANIFNNRTSLGGATNQPLQPPRKTKERIELQEVKNAEALLIDDLLLFTKKISQVASLFLFICENKLRQNLNNAVFSEYKVDLLNLKFRDLFGEKRHEKVLKDYVMATIKLDPKYTDQARLILNQFNIIFQERDFSISQAEIKLQAILQKVAQNGMPDKKYLNECTSILLDHIEHLQIEYLNRFYQIYSALDAREDFVRILLDCYKFHHRINENIERQQIELSAMEEQLRMSASYAPVNQYSEQLKITKQLLEDNAVQTNFCLEKLIEIIENLHKESLLQQKNTQSKAYKEAQIQTIISILQHYPFEAVHGAVVESLLRNKRKTEILKLNSPFTEQVLESFGKKRAECQNCQDCFYCLFYLDCLKIKFKYFEQLGNIREAYKVAFEISNFKNNEDINSDMVFLSDRIDFTDIAIYDVSLILSDFNISQEEKQNFIQEKEILQKQLKVLKVQKRIHDKLSLSLSFIEGNLKKIKDTNQKKAIEEQKKNYQECSEVLSIIKLDEGQLEKYIIQNLNLVEFSLILYDLIPENQLPGNPDKLYEQLITRMSSADSFETEPWPLNIQNTLSMLNSEITNKNLFSLQTIILKGENVNAERTWKDQQNIRQFLDLYSGILANREDASARILNSSYWMPHFLITYLNFSPLTLISTYSPIWNIFFSNKEANRQVLKNYIHLTNCLMLLLKHSVSYISNVLLNQSTKSSEIIAVKKSIQAIERILDSFNNDAFTAVREAAGSESEVIQYQQQFERVQQDLLEQISAIQQLGGGDTQSRGGLGNSTNEFASFAGGSTLSGAKNLLFNFEQELPKQQQSSQEQQQYQQQSSLKSNSWNFPSDPDTVLFKQDQQSQNLQRNSSLNSKGNNNALDGFDKSETLKTTKYYQIREQDNEEEEGIVFDKKQRA